MKHLIYLNLSSNKIVGQIPSTILNCSFLKSLSLSHNYINGSIPSRIGDFHNSLYNIDLSFNNLTGNIPLSLIKINVFDLIYNSLEGRIPDNFKKYEFDRFMGNKNLCGDINRFPPCLPSSQTMRQVKIFVPLTVFFILLLLKYFFHSRCRVRKTQSKSTGTKNGDMFSIWNYDGKIANEDIIKVTEDFDIR